MRYFYYKCLCVLRICHFSLALALRCPIHFSLALALASCGAACRGLRSDTDQEGADAVYVPTPTMAALSPDPPSSPMFDDAQRQPGPGTDHEGADAVDAPMAMERRSPGPPPRSESGARWKRQPTSFRALTLRPPYTVESIFDNYSKRRGALIRALTEGSKRESASDLCACLSRLYSSS